MKKFMVVVALAAVFSCKPKSGDSEVSAIVGTENGQERAFGIVALRNDVQMNKEIDFIKSPKMRKAWEDMNEVFYAMVECGASTSNGTRISAAQWMNWVEYVSFAGILYVTPDRRLEYTLTNGAKLQNYSPNCRLRPTRLMNLPMVMGVSKGINGFPAEAPAKDSAKYKELRKTYELMQTVFLALRGPYSPGGGLGISPKAFGFQESAAKYPTIDFSATDLAVAMHGADPAFNPCVRPKKTGAALDYLQDWKFTAYSCVPSAAKGVYNYQAGGANGARYAELRDNAERQLAAIFAGAYGAIQSGASSERQLLEILTHPLPWKDIDGPSSGLAAYLAGQSSAGSSLTAFDHESFFEGHRQSAIGFGLDGKPSALQISRSRLQAQQFAEMLAQGEITSADQMVPYFKNDWSSVAENIDGKSGDGVILWKPRRDQEVDLAFQRLQKSAQATLQQRENLFETWGKIDPDRASGTETAQKYSQYHGQTMDQFRKELLAYNENQLKTANINSLYSNKKTELGVTSYKNFQNDFLVGGGGQDGGKVQDLRVDKPLNGSDIKYQWDQANVDTNPSDFIDVNRKVGWNNDGSGFQTVKTGGLDGQPGLNFDYGFQANPKSDSKTVGRFTMDTSQMADATSQLNTMVASTKESVTAVNQSSGSGIWDGMKQFGGGFMAAGQAQSGINQIGEQNRFSGTGTAITQTMNTASTELTGLRDNALSASGAGFNQAWTGTKEYVGSGQAWNDASTAMSNGASYLGNTFFGGGTGSTGGTGAQPAPPQAVPPPQATPIQKSNSFPSGETMYAGSPSSSSDPFVSGNVGIALTSDLESEPEDADAKKKPDEPGSK